MYEFILGLVFGAISAALLTAVVTGDNGRSDTMREAYERGHAVQCIGKTGYHWECEK